MSSFKVSSSNRFEFVAYMKAGGGARLLVMEEFSAELSGA